jgi:hypothetical protein
MDPNLIVGDIGELEEKNINIITDTIKLFVNEQESALHSADKIKVADKMFSYIYVNRWYLNIPESRYRRFKSAALNKLQEYIEIWPKAELYYNALENVSSVLREVEST